MLVEKRTGSVILLAQCASFRGLCKYAIGVWRFSEIGRQKGIFNYNIFIIIFFPYAPDAFRVYLYGSICLFIVWKIKHLY